MGGDCRALIINRGEGDIDEIHKGLIATESCVSIQVAATFSIAKTLFASSLFSLVVTHISTLQQEGLDFLVFLKTIQFKGKIIAVTNNADRIRFQLLRDSLGAMKLFKAPIEQKVLHHYFEGMKERPGLDQSRPLNLIALLYVISMEKLSILIQVDRHKEIGFIYFVEGTPILAEYASETGLIEGEPALLKMIAIDETSYISTRPLSRKKVKNNIGHDVIKEIVQIVQTIDQQYELQNRLKKVNINIENRIRMNDILSKAKMISGFLGIGLFTTEGELMAGESELDGIHFERFGAQVQLTLLVAQKMSVEAGFGTADMIQVDNENGVVFAICLNVDGRPSHIILVIKKDGNVATAKKKLKEIVVLLQSLM